MPKSIAELKDAAQKRLSKIAKKEKLAKLTEVEINDQYDAMVKLAEANVKSMTKEQARQWARQFISEHPGEDAKEWAWCMVGRVDVHQESKPGPRPGVAEVSEHCIKLVSTAARLEKLGSKNLSKDEFDKLVSRVVSLCKNELVAHFDRRQIRQALKHIF